MLQLNFGPIMHARGIARPYSFLRQHGFTHHTASRLAANKLKVVSLEHLERICELLYCTPNDILHWAPAAGHPLPAGHPLTALTPVAYDETFLAALRTLSLEDLRKVATVIRQAKEG